MLSIKTLCPGVRSLPTVLYCGLHLELLMEYLYWHPNNDNAIDAILKNIALLSRED